MQFNISKKFRLNSNSTIIPFYKNQVDNDLVKEITGMKSLPNFNGDFQETLTLYRKDNDAKVILLGLGNQNEDQRVFEVFRRFTFNYKKNGGKSLNMYIDHLDEKVLFALVYGSTLGSYRIAIKKKDEIKPNILPIDIYYTGEGDHIIHEASLTAHCQMEAMKLVDTPSNIKTPYFIANYAVKSGKKYGYSTNVIKDKDLIKRGLTALYAIGQGSSNPSAFIEMVYKGAKSKKGTKTIGLVGKGISFDTGGISIKPNTNMHFMKSDMGGAAAVIGTINLVAALKLPINVVAIVPSAENAVDGNSVKPGDIINTYSGHTIEIIDTDAEGRVVLADGIAYMIKNHKPDVLIDIATLTGSCVATLGYSAAGLFTSNDELAEQISKVGFSIQEKVWRLPIWDDYKDFLHSDIADVKNLSGKPVAGAISAAKFLEFFTDNHPSWAHLDIAGVAFSESEYAKMRSATGYGVKLMSSIIKMYCD